MRIKRSLAVLLMVAMAAGAWCAPARAENGTDPEGTATPTDLGEDEEQVEFREDPEPVVTYDVNGETIEIQGDVCAKGHNRDITAIAVTSGEGAKSSVTAHGNVVATGTDESYSHAGSTGVEISSRGEGSDVNIVIGEGVVSVMKWTNPDKGDNIDCAGISIEVEDGGSVALTVGNGGIYSEATSVEKDSSYTWSAGLHLYNTDGTADALVDGDVTAESTIYGVGLNSHLYGSEKALTVIVVNGDVYGSTRGIWAEHTNPNGTMEMIVNGQVSGGTDNILMNGSNSDGILLTVWKLEPDQDGILIRTENEMEESIRAEEAEKNLQYIIRLTTRNNETIETDAAEYRGYQVAREGDTVHIRITPPAGSEIMNVFGNAEKSLVLEQDTAGSYILVMPRSGGVDISVTLRNKNNRSDSRTKTKTPLMILAADSAETDRLKKSVADESDIASLLPDSVQGSIPADARMLEVLTMTLVNYTEEAGTPELILPVTQAYREGEEVIVAFVLPRDGRNTWFTVKAIGTTDGKLSFCPEAEMLAQLADRTFLAMILGGGDAE